MNEKKNTLQTSEKKLKSAARVERKERAFGGAAPECCESGEREENTMVKTERRKKIWSKMLPTKISRLPDSLICFLACAGGGREGCVKYAGKKLRGELFTF